MHSIRNAACHEEQNRGKYNTEQQKWNCSVEQQASVIRPPLPDKNNFSPHRSNHQPSTNNHNNRNNRNTLPSSSSSPFASAGCGCEA
jgi:hypothetical protein